MYRENLNKTEPWYDVTFDIEIYTINKGKVSKQEIANELMTLVNDIFDDFYGMNRVLNKQVPNADSNIFKWNMMFEAKVDENKKIYRR